MTDRISGLHHVTAIAGDTRENLEFYTDVLGLRLIKQTVNFDDPATYHLYYGDEVGHPGTVLTFFPFEGARAGSVGRGQTSATAFVIDEGSLEYWLDRLDEKDVDFQAPSRRFDQRVISLSDPDGQPLELVTGTSGIEPWTAGPVPAEHAIRGFFGVTLDSLDFTATVQILEMLGFTKVDEQLDRTRFRGAEDFATVVDVLERPDGLVGDQGVGTVHHIAFRTPDTETQDQWRERLMAAGHHVTERRDRQYFQSIYFREPGGVLFEIATEGPGFAVDESVESLGSELKLPPWLEMERDRIEAHLPPIDEE